MEMVILLDGKTMMMMRGEKNEYVRMKVEKKKKKFTEKVSKPFE